MSLKLELEIPNSYIDNAFSEPHSRYWCKVLDWDKQKRTGYALENYDSEVHHDFTEEDVVKGLQLMAKDAPWVLAAILADDNDGPQRDIFVQFVVLGEHKYMG